MMNNLFFPFAGFVNSLLLPFLCGYVLLKFLFRRSDIKMEMSLVLALSGLLGFGICFHLMLVIGWIGWELNVKNISLGILAFCAFFVALSGRGMFFHPKINMERRFKFLSAPSIPSLLLLILMGIYFLYVFHRAMTWPVYEWDTMSASGLAGKVFFIHRSLAYQPNVPHPSYPLHIPFLFTWVALNARSWDNPWVKFFFPLNFLMFAVILYHFLKFYTGPLWGKFGVVLLLSCSFPIFHATLTYRDLVIMTYICSALFFLIMWRDVRDDAFLFLASVLAGLATFVKLEGQPYLVVLWAVCFFILLEEKMNLKTYLQKFFKCAVPSLLIFMIFHVYKISKGIDLGAKAVIDFTWHSLPRIPDILKAFISEIFFTSNWNIIWPVFILSLVVGRQRLGTDKQIKMLILALFFFVGVYFFVGLLTEQYVYLLSEAVLSRLFLHFMPLAVVLIILLNYFDSQN